MKISKAREMFHQQHPFQLKIFKKGIFRILLAEEAFFVAEYFSMKLTPHDKSHIKVGFPLSSQDRWLGLLRSKGLGYVLIDKVAVSAGESQWQVITSVSGKYYTSLMQVDVENFHLTRQRILGLGRMGLEEVQQKNFLLKDKIEAMYLLISQWLIKIPKIERRYFREKIERMLMDVLGLVYEYMYIPSTRSHTIEQMYQHCMIIREYTRFLYKMGKIKNDTVFLDAGDRRVEILKIIKTLKNKQESL